ncbi:uncharacterized protein [Taeniopygia guttata]|uniref:uncharacterized protein n=1 Tax=Taeniopygia guttata TaxID=59729 RepID=UPI003BB8ED9C
MTQNQGGLVSRVKGAPAVRAHPGLGAPNSSKPTAATTGAASPLLLLPPNVALTALQPRLRGTGAPGHLCGAQGTQHLRTLRDRGDPAAPNPLGHRRPSGSEPIGTEGTQRLRTHWGRGDPAAPNPLGQREPSGSEPSGTEGIQAAPNPPGHRGNAEVPHGFLSAQGPQPLRSPGAAAGRAPGRPRSAPLRSRGKAPAARTALPGSPRPAALTAAVAPGGAVPRGARCRPGRAGPGRAGRCGAGSPGRERLSPGTARGARRLREEGGGPGTAERTEHARGRPAPGRRLGPVRHRGAGAAPEGSGRAEPSRAEPSRAEPSRAEPSRAEPSRAEPPSVAFCPTPVPTLRLGTSADAHSLSRCWLS